MIKSFVPRYFNLFLMSEDSPSPVHTGLQQPIKNPSPSSLLRLAFLSIEVSLNTYPSSVLYSETLFLKVKTQGGLGMVVAAAPRRHNLSVSTTVMWSE